MRKRPPNLGGFFYARAINFFTFVNMLNQFSKLFVGLANNNRLERILLLAKVDFKRRYYDTGLGVMWALLNPLFRFVVYYFAFTYIFENRIPNFALYLFSGLIIWLFFAGGSKKGISLLKRKRYLLENIQFNQFDLFFASILSAFYAFGFNFLAYFIVSLIYGIPIYTTLLWLPLLLLNLWALTMGVSIILATINIYLRDIEHLWDMVILGGFWLTPILYDKSITMEVIPALQYINPVAGILINIREIALYGNAPYAHLLIYDWAYTIILLMIAVFVYKRFSHMAVEKF